MLTPETIKTKRLIKSTDKPIITHQKTNTDPSTVEVANALYCVQTIINEGNVTTNCVACHINIVHNVIALHLCISMLCVLNQKALYVSVKKLAGEIALKKHKVNVYSNAFQNGTFIPSFLILQRYTVACIYILKGIYNSNNVIHTGANWLVVKALVN